MEWLKNGNVFLIVLKAGKTKSKVAADSIPDPISNLHVPTFSPCPHVALSLGLHTHTHTHAYTHTWGKERKKASSLVSPTIRMLIS